MTILTLDPATVNSDAPADIDVDAPADIEPTGPTADDAAWWAGQNTEWHSDEPGPDWDAMADEAPALAAYCDGFLPL